MGNKEREAFRQVILKMAKYRLRRVMHLAGYTQQEVREAEIAGEDRMVELIMTKFDDGAINILSLDKEKDKSSSEASTPRTAKREAAKSKPKDDDDDPYSKAFDDDDSPSPEPDPEPEPDADEEQPREVQDDDSVENHEAEAPPRKGRRAKREEPRQAEETPDHSAIEAKMDGLLEAVVSMGNAIGEISDKVNTLLAFVEGSVQFEEVMKLAMARIFKMGTAEPLKGFADLFERSRPFVDKRLGRTVEDE